MTFSGDCLNGRSQLLIQPDNCKFVVGTGLVSLIPPSLPLPAFVIDDLVGEDWIDEFNENRVDYGEVFGICWHPRKKVWAYLIDWTSGGGPDSVYPCFDQQLVIGGLRLVSHG